MKPIQVGDVVGDYQVIDIAGTGGMGAVYKIEHRITKRIEAMKLLPPGLSSDPEQLRRFEREIQLQASLSHPNIVALYNAVREGDSIALVMEFVEGETLQRLIESGPLLFETTVAFASQVLRALAYAHDAGVIHRDVSPSNIIITPERVAKLTDFGLARGPADLRLSTSGVPLGSPWYMSPEQVTGNHKLDARTDLYAMGAVLHEMLTGRKLFEADGAFAVMRAHVEAEPVPPSSLNPQVPPALDYIVRRAVSKDPAMRFGSADEFRLALQHLDAQPISVSSNRRKAGNVSRPPARLRLRQVRLTRKAMLLAAAPAALVAGVCAIRFLPATPRHQMPPGNPPAAVAPTQESEPAPVAIITPPTAQPVEPPPSEVEAPVPEAPPQPEIAPAAEEAGTKARHRIQTPAKTTRRPNQAERSFALRVTGMEPPPPAATPSPKPILPQPVESPEPPPPVASSPQAPEPGSPPAAPASSEPAPAAQESAAANTQNTGNRLVRALGKMNPFRKRTKHDPSKDQPDKN